MYYLLNIWLLTGEEGSEEGSEEEEHTQGEYGMALAPFMTDRRWNGENTWEEMDPAEQQRVLSRPSRPAVIMVMGHSFIDRLNKYIVRRKGGFNNLNLEFTNAVVHIHGVGGRTVQKCRYLDLAVVAQIKPDIIYLELGTNELCRVNNTPEKVAVELHDLANDLLGLGVSQIVAGQVIQRAGRAIPRAVPDINHRIKTFNEMCGALFDRSVSPGCTFWSHMGLWRSTKKAEDGQKETTLANTRLGDGVHLSDQGTHRLYKSIRGAVIQAIDRIPHILAQ